MLKIRMSIQGDLTIFLLSGRIEGECISDRKSTRLNSSHTVISYAVFCLKKKQTTLISYIDSRVTSTRHAIAKVKNPSEQEIDLDDRYGDKERSSGEHPEAAPARGISRRR